MGTLFFDGFLIDIMVDNGASVGINYLGIYMVKVILTEIYMLENFL